MLKTPERDPLHLVCFLRSGKLTGLYVVGDTVSLRVPRKSVESGVFTVLAAYYVFDVEFPKQYAMFFAILQSFVLNQPYTKQTSKKYAFLLKKLRNAWKQTPDTSDEDERPSDRKTGDSMKRSSDACSDTPAAKRPNTKKQV